MVEAVDQFGQPHQTETLDYRELTMKAIVPTTILGHKPSGKCDVTGKDNVEVFVVRIGRGEPRCIAAKSLLETLRLTCSIVLQSESKPAAGAE